MGGRHNKSIMKHIATTFLFLGLSAFCAVGQNVTVMMKDGSSHKFNADYLSELSFQDVVPETPPVVLNTVNLDIYSGGNVTATFIGEGGNVEIAADLYGPADAIYMNTGTYTYATTSAPFTFNPQYSHLKINGEQKTFTDGEIVVSLEEKTYTFDITLTLSDNSTYRAKYVGPLPQYTPWIECTLSQAKYIENPQIAGDFYVKFNDPDWKYDMAIIFTAQESDKTLPAGEYTLSDTRAPFTISNASYIDQFNPNANLKLAPGSKVNVAKDGEDYIIVMELNLNDGRTAKYTYQGQITGTPTFESSVEEWSQLIVSPFGNTNTTLYFYKTANSAADGFLSLDCYFPQAAFFPTGEYIIGGDSGMYISTSDISYTNYNPDGSENGAIALTSGKMTVTRDGSVYTFNLEALLANGDNLAMTYTGELDQFGPTVAAELSAASYEENNARPQGNMYVKFNDEDWNYTIALDMYAAPSATTLPAGTYAYATTGAENTFGEKSYVDITSPYSSNKMAEGSTVTVEVDANSVYTITMNLKFVDGREGNFTYNGSITGTPKFE